MKTTEMIRGVNPAALIDLIERFGRREALYMTGLSRFQLNELIDIATTKP